MNKTIKYTCLAVVAATGFSSCSDSYFDVDMEQNKTSETAYQTAKDVKNGLTGAYNALGSYRFYGRNVVAIGDMASDLATASASSGHFVALNTYVVTETNTELTDVWDYGYKVIDRAVRTINGGQAILAGGNATKNDEYIIYSSLSQSYALRALATFTLTNIFGLPYQPGQHNSQPGVVLVADRPVTISDRVSRSSVEDCYQQVLDDIQKAKDYYVGEDDMNGSPQFYFNLAAIHALEARVNLFMGNYAAAREAAVNAITERASNGVTPAGYVAMWSSVAISPEDIFTISKTTDDNLSANALNTLYGSFKGTVTAYTESMFSENDIRAAMLGTYGFKWCGLATAQAVSNIPVFRLSEMYLIAAESAAMTNHPDEAREYLFYTAQRNQDITSTGSLPQTRDELMEFISDERVRELYLEGHRWYDARRNGLKITVAAGTAPNFDVARFVYPIPAGEINTGFGVEQNPGWEDNLPNR